MANLTLDKIGEMKTQSATGATGLGTITEKELDLLGAAVDSLNQALTTKDLEAATDRVLERYNNLIKKAQEGGQTVARKYQYLQNLLEPKAEAEAKVKTWNPKLNNGRGGFE